MGRKKQGPRPELPVVTRYYGEDGRQCRKGTPGAAARTTRSETYAVRLPDPETGKRKWYSLGTPDQGEAWRQLGELLKRRALEAAGIDTPRVRQAVRPIAEHLADWAAQLHAAGKTSAKQVGQLEARLAKLCELAGWSRLPHLTRDSALKALAKLQSETPANVAAGHEGRSPRTRNHYLRHLKQFTAWLVAEGRLAADPVAACGMVDVESDVRHRRRNPTAGEIARLMAYLEGSYTPPGAAEPLAPKRRSRMTGPQRALGYRLCMATGFRAKELRLLKRESFDLERGTVAGRSSTTKNRKLARTPLPPWLLEEVRAHFEAGGGPWTFPASHPGRILDDDLRDCGIEPEAETDEGTAYFDFHSLRVWYITWAANTPGISPKALQTMARHSDPKLTMNTYAKPQEEEIRRLTDAMPRPGNAPVPGTRTKPAPPPRPPEGTDVGG